jgi:predicted permease
VLYIVATIVAATATGLAYERRAGARAGAVARRVMTIQLYVLVPPVVFFNIAQLEIDADVGVGIVIGWAALLAAGGIAFLVGTRALRLSRPETGSLVNCALQGNTGYLGLPLAAAALGPEHVSEAVAYDALVQGPILFVVVFGVGAAMGTKAGERASDRMRAFLTRNPVIWMVLAGLVAPDALAPDVLVDLSRIIVFALLPLAFFAVGVTLGQERASGAAAFPPPFGQREAAAVVLRLVVAPALLLALSAPFIDLPAAYLLAAATPAGINGLVVAHAYGLDLGFTASAIAWTTSVAAVVGLGVVVLG